MLIFKYITTNNNKDLLKEFRKQADLIIFKNNKSEFEVELFLQKLKKNPPFIYFHDEEDFQIDLTELNSLSHADSIFN